MSTLKLFVAMPYGPRSGSLDSEQPASLVTIDFDQVWEGMLSPAIPARFEAKRASDLRRSGTVDKMYIEWLLEADVVLADLTFGNPNVYYELGIRQALSRKGAVLVASRGTRLPFDVRNQSVIEYDHSDATSLIKFQRKLSIALETAASEESSSPVHDYLPGLYVARYLDGGSPRQTIERLERRIAELEKSLEGKSSQSEVSRLLRRLDEADTGARVLAIYNLVVHSGSDSLELAEPLAIKLRKYGHLDQALEILQKALAKAPEDSEMLREIGFVYRKKGPEFFQEAQEYMTRSLALNDLDAELHGMIGGLLKRRGNLEDALLHYERAHEIEPENNYSLVNLGGMCGVLGKTAAARTWYGEVRDNCHESIARQAFDYWTCFCLGEAEAALGNPAAALQAYRMAVELKPPIEDLRSAIEQLQFLQAAGFAVGAIGEILPELRFVLEK